MIFPILRYSPSLRDVSSLSSFREALSSGASPLFSRAAAQEGKTHSITTAQLRRDIARAVACQRGRQHERNSRIPSEELKRLCPLTSEARRILDSGVYDFSFSPRAVSSCIKLARTIADMDGSDEIQSAHMEEAVSLRKNEGGISLCF